MLVSTSILAIKAYSIGERRPFYYPLIIYTLSLYIPRKSSLLISIVLTNRHRSAREDKQEKDEARLKDKQGRLDSDTNSSRDSCYLPYYTVPYFCCFKLSIDHRLRAGQDRTHSTSGLPQITLERLPAHPPW